MSVKVIDLNTEEAKDEARQSPATSREAPALEAIEEVKEEPLETEIVMKKTIIMKK